MKINYKSFVEMSRKLNASGEHDCSEYDVGGGKSLLLFKLEPDAKGNLFTGAVLVNEKDVANFVGKYEKYSETKSGIDFGTLVTTGRGLKSSFIIYKDSKSRDESKMARLDENVYSFLGFFAGENNPGGKIFEEEDDVIRVFNLGIETGPWGMVLPNSSATLPVRVIGGGAGGEGVAPSGSVAPRLKGMFSKSLTASDSGRGK